MFAVQVVIVHTHAKIADYWLMTAYAKCPMFQVRSGRSIQTFMQCNTTCFVLDKSRLKKPSRRETWRQQNTKRLWIKYLLGIRVSSAWGGQRHAVWHNHDFAPCYWHANLHLRQIATGLQEPSFRVKVVSPNVSCVICVKLPPLIAFISSENGGQGSPGKVSP